MAERYTGFMETSDGELMLTTIGPVDVDVLLERLRARLAELPAGVNVRVDLISYADDDDVPFNLADALSEETERLRRANEGTGFALPGDGE